MTVGNTGCVGIGCVCHIGGCCVAKIIGSMAWATLGRVPPSPSSPIATSMNNGLGRGAAGSPPMRAWIAAALPLVRMARSASSIPAASSSESGAWMKRPSFAGSVASPTRKAVTLSVFAAPLLAPPRARRVAFPP